MIEFPLIRGSATDMQKIDGFYLYSTGYTLHAIEALQPGADFQAAFLTLFLAKSWLVQLMDQSVFQLRTSRVIAGKFAEALDQLLIDYNRTEPLAQFEAYTVTAALHEFETVLNAEFGMMDIYLVRQKRGYDTASLIENGVVLLPPDLPRKVPESVSDFNQATRCIAFELPSAAGFHLHRAAEAVLRRYYDAVTNGAPKPNSRTIGAYLSALEQKKAGDAAVLSALKDMKDLHRNPLIHPEHSLETVDEAIALVGGIQAVVVPMLKAIPEPSLALPSPAPEPPPDIGPAAD